MQNLPVSQNGAKAVQRAAAQSDDQPEVPIRPSMTAPHFRHVLRVVTGQAKYCDEMYDRYMERTAVFFGKHPIMGNDLSGGDVEFIGTIGNSGSVGAWQRMIVKQYADTMGDLMPLAFTIYRCPNRENANQNHIFAECELGYPPADGKATQVIYRYLCSGMTDYSGEGSSAYNLVQQFMTAFVVVHPDCRLVVADVQGDTDALMQRIQDDVDAKLADYPEEGDDY